MGICASCFRQSDDDASLQGRQTESTPLLQDPALILAPAPRPEPNPEDVQRQQAHLDSIVQRASDSLVNIKAYAQTDAGGLGDASQRQDKVKQLEGILDRLLVEARPAQGDAGDAEYGEAHKTEPVSSPSQSQLAWSLQPVGRILVPLASS